MVTVPADWTWSRSQELARPLPCVLSQSTHGDRDSHSSSLRGPVLAPGVRTLLGCGHMAQPPRALRHASLLPSGYGPPKHSPLEISPRGEQDTMDTRASCPLGQESAACTHVPPPQTGTDLRWGPRGGGPRGGSLRLRAFHVAGLPVRQRGLESRWQCLDMVGPCESAPCGSRPGS